MPRRFALLVLTATLVAATGPTSAYAEDNGLEDPNSCAGIGGGPDVPSGTWILVSQGFPVPPGVPPSPDGSTFVWICDGGHWVFGGTISHEAPLAVDATSVEVPEGTRAAMTGTYAGDGAGLVTFSSSIGAAAPDTNSTWSWSATTDDGPATQQVVVSSTADGKQVTTAFGLNVTNVPPTVTSWVPSVATALIGQPVTFSGTATDPSAADTAAGFTWAVAGGATQSFNTCGSHTVTATATDKDGGVSDALAAGPVDVVEAAYQAPLIAGWHNIVKAGQVVPVKVAVGCGGTTLGGLSPTIRLLSGDVDAETKTDDPSLNVPATDASGDTSGVMRQVGGSYLYNLRVPKVPSGTLLTVRVSPVAGASLQLVLQVR